MATTIGNEDNVLDLLKNLIQLDFDAVDAYQAAIDRMDDPTRKQVLATFRGDHERHTRDLSSYLDQLGGTPPSKGDMKRFLTQGKVVVAAIAGDKAILKAMKSNEDDTNTAYEQASARTDLDAQLSVLLARNLSDERRHRDWIEAQIEILERGESTYAPPSGP